MQVRACLCLFAPCWGVVAVGAALLVLGVVVVVVLLSDDVWWCLCFVREP
jgi:hypothetical protein